MTRSGRYLLILSCAAILGLYVFCLNSRFGFDDQAIFINLANTASASFSNFGHLIRLLRQIFIHYLSDHPLYVTGLVFLNYLCSGNIYLTVIIVKFFNILFIAASAYILFRILVRDAGNRLLYPSLVVLLTVFNPDIFNSANKLITEIPFMFSLLGSIYCFEMYLEEINWPRAVGYLSLSIIYFLSASLLRDVGYLLAPAIVVYGAIRKRPLKTVVFLALFTLPGIWEITMLKNQAFGYLDTIFTNSHGFAGRCLWYSQFGIPQILVPFNLVSRWPVLAYAITLTVITGFLFKVTQKISIIDLYSLCYIFLFLTNSEVSGRWLIPIIPFLIYYFVNGLAGLTAIGVKFLRHQVGAEENSGRKVTMAAVMAMVMIYGYLDIDYAAKMQANSLFYPPIAKNYAEAAGFIARDSLGNSNIMSAQSGYVSLYSNLPADGIHKVPPEEQWQIIIEGKYDYLIVSHSNEEGLISSDQYLINFINGNKDRFREIYNSDNKVFVYKVVKDIEIELTHEENLLQNPGFEQMDQAGKYVGWQRWGRAGLDILPDPGKKNTLVFIRNDTGFEALRQEVLLDKSKTYNLSFYARTDSPGSFRVDFDKKKLEVTEKQLHQYSLNFIPTDDHVLFELRQYSPGETWVSDIKLHETAVQSKYMFEGFYFEPQSYEFLFYAKTDKTGTGRFEFYSYDNLLASVKIESPEWKQYSLKIKKMPFKSTFLFVQREIGSTWINKVKLVNLVNGKVSILYDK